MQVATESSQLLLTNVMDFLRNLQKVGENDTEMCCDPTEDGGENTEEENTEEEEERTFEDIPINTQLQILSYLDVMCLCRSAQVCRLWNQLTEDTLLWNIKLEHDSKHWEIIDHLTHPENYRRTCPDLTPKEIYLKCCPAYRHQDIGGTNPSQLTRLRNYFGLLVPRIVMFGSGLDESGLVSRILWDKRSPFTVNGMFPGQFEGIGSGVSLHHQYGSINLITLYALPKYERENPDNVKISKLLVEESADSGELTLSQPVKQLCATIDSFIYVIDATRESKVTFRIDEFKTMIDDRWLQAKARVLVLCVIPDATVDSVSSLQVADKLDLLNLSRPWQVRQCHVNSLYGFVPGLQWVTEHV